MIVSYLSIFILVSACNVILCSVIKVSQKSRGLATYTIRVDDAGSRFV